MNHESLARELAEAALKEFNAWRFSISADIHDVLPECERSFLPILAKHNPPSNTPDMEALVERIAELAVRTAESLNRGHYIPAMTEMLKPIISNELAPLAKLLRECRPFVENALHTAECLNPDECGDFADEPERFRGILFRIDNFIGGDNGGNKAG